MDKEQNQRQQHFEEKPRNTHSVCNLMAYVQMLLPSILLCSWGRLMWMLMQNLISLQHALSAPNPNCVEYRAYIFLSSALMNSLFHKICRAGCKTCAILACKHWSFLFPGYGDDTDGGSKKDMKINLFKLRPCKTKPTRFPKWWVNQQRPDSDVTQIYYTPAQLCSLFQPVMHILWVVWSWVTRLKKYPNLCKKCSRQ